MSSKEEVESAEYDINSMVPQRRKRFLTELPPEIIDRILLLLVRIGDRVRIGKTSRIMYKHSMPLIYESWSFDKYKHPGYCLWCFLRTAIEFPQSVSSVKTLDLRESEPPAPGKKSWDTDLRSVVSAEQFEVWEKSQRDDLNVFKNSRIRPWVLKYLDNWTNSLSEYILLFRWATGASLVESHGFENFALVVLNLIIQRLPNIEILHITSLSRAYELGAQDGLPLSAHYLQNLRTVYISRGSLKLPHSCFPGSSLLLRFWDLPRIRSVYTSDLISVAFDKQRWDKRSPDESQSAAELVLYSAITDLSLVRCNVSACRVFQIVSTLQELVRFRWTYKFPSSLSNEDERLDLGSKIIRKILDPYKGSLKELDLRFVEGISDRPLPKPGVQSKAKEKPLFLGDFSDFQVMTSLTIDPIVLTGRSLGDPIEHHMEDLLPQSLKYLALVCELSHSKELYPGPTSIRKQTWSDEVTNFANTLPASMRFLTEVQLIAPSPSPGTSLGWNGSTVERDELLEPVKRLFQEKGVICSITNNFPGDEFSDFRTISEDN
ncbi:hypothetical protein BOTNAR_0179g00060 [Botryotinia narcissicola]|uniref:Uncharacterized protein n=1 Tax=Botryotinia narcissicola TaxID=278944 RepID=A0A4Z1IAU7_9HELO|nr:hypothetical protein BOTNAR_0179g00060 [Botryotinia narcissicola]